MLTVVAPTVTAVWGCRCCQDLWTNVRIHVNV